MRTYTMATTSNVLCVMFLHRSAFSFPEKTKIQQEMAVCVENSMKDDGVQTHVEIVQSTWDWHSYLAPINVMAHGITIQESEESVNHSFRMVLRSDIKNYLVHGSEYPWDVHSAPPPYIIVVSR